MFITAVGAFCLKRLQAPFEVGNPNDFPFTLSKLKTNEVSKNQVNNYN